jgi:DNA-binding SARP family transcriptional activator/predicted negative regulator of RcsB-dependent stress response
MGSPDPSSARIFLLGTFAVEVAGGLLPASAWRKRRPVELLAALALSPGRVLHREELIDRLWPDKDLDAGANNLHRAFHDLRRVTGAELATLDRGVARLAETVWIDVEAFERAAASASTDSLAQAVELYRGALLPDDPYSDALATRREALRQRFVDAGLRLANLHHEGGQPETCIDVLRRLLTQDPTIEPAHQLLMRALADTGRTGEALRQFAECTSALRSRLDVAPAKATLDLRAAIERGDIDIAARAAKAPSTPARSEPPQPEASLVVRRLLGGDPSRPQYGRAEEVEAVRRFIGGGHGVLLLVGEAGLGKTRLASECARVAAATGATVLVGIGLDHDSGVPYAPFADAWAHRRRAAGAPAEDDPFVSFSPAGGSAQEDRLRLFQSVERSLVSLGNGRSVCLIVEDLHQADPSSIHLFHHLARATHSLPLLLVGTLRDDEVHVGRAVHTLLGNLGRERLGTRLVLRRIDQEATGHLVAHLLNGSGRAADDEVIAAVHALAEGNPFHTEEVVQAMRDEGSSHPSAPKNLLDTVRQRVRRLGRDAERLLSAAALFGLRFPFDVAQLAAGLTAEVALEALELGIEARIIEEEGDEYRFRHALTRKALLDALTHARRVYLHRALAEALETRGVSRHEEHAEVLSLHHEGAGQLDRALPYLLIAGERAQRRLGFSESVAFFERALALMDATGRTEGAERFRVLRSLGGMRMALSDLDGAVRDLDAAATLTTDDFQPNATQRALVRRVAALALIQGGRLDEAGERLEDAEAALRDAKNDPELPPVLYLLAQLRWHQEKYADARELAQRSLTEAEARGDRAAMAKGHEMLALACHSLGAWREGHAHEKERQSLADGRLDVDQAFDVHLCLWEYHLYGDQESGDIRTAVEQMLEQARRMKAPRAIALCENFAGTVDFLAGRWDEADAQLRRAIEGFRLVGSASGEALSLQRLAILLTARGQLDEARRLLGEGIVVGERAAMRSHCLTRMYASLARNRLAAGDHPSACESLQEGLAEAARHGHCTTCNSLLLPEAVRVELASGNVSGAETYARALDDVARRFGSRAWTAMAEHARGRVAVARGDVDEARAALERARQAFEEIGSPYEAARCAMAASRLPGAKNGPLPAERAALAQAARRTFERLGAVDLEA